MRKRDVRIWARVNEEEFEAIARRVQKTGLSREAYVRSVLLGSVPREKPDERFYSAMQGLAGMAAAVGHLARKTSPLAPRDMEWLKAEAGKWGRLQADIRRAALLPDKM